VLHQIYIKTTGGSAVYTYLIISKTFTTLRYAPVTFC